MTQVIDRNALILITTRTFLHGSTTGILAVYIATQYDVAIATGVQG